MYMGNSHEATYQALVENTKDAIIGLDLDGNITTWNNGAEMMLGYKAEEVIGKSQIILVPEEFIEPCQEHLREATLNGFVMASDSARKVKDGSTIPVATTLSAIYDDDDEQIGFVNIFRDITERKLVENELRLHSEIMGNMHEGVYLIRTSDLSIVYSNPKFERMFGYEPGEMVGQHVSIVNAPTDQDPLETAKEISAVLEETGEWQGEIKNIKKDGTHFWCYANVSVFNHPEYGDVLVSVHSDITKRKNLEEILKKEQADLKRMNKLMVGRETRMIELKKEINSLLGELGRGKKYSW